ncbi:MAG: hypothetical protein HPY75_04620 [Actinobacteria bacterium]|nr:hypothetical protein [Actinomycetota bacterium]
MTFFEAAKKVLEESGGKPMHYKDITRTAMEKGYLESSGLTPEQTLAAQLYTYIRRTAAAGKTPEISLIGQGRFALSKKPRFGLEKEIEDWNKRTRDELLETLMELDPRAFENLIGRLLVEIGFEDVKVTRYSGDGGIDVEAELTVGGVTNVKTAVQVKRWKNKITGRTVRELRGGLLADQRGLIITTSGFTKDAVSEAYAEGKTPISLIDGEKLIDLLVENGIGISKRNMQYLELDLSSIVVDGDGDDGKNRMYQGIWPLPGGVNKFAESAKTMLSFIAENEPGLRSLKDWVMEEFPTVKSEKTLDGYIRVLRILGVVDYDGQAFKVTEAGRRAVEGDESKVLGNQLKERITGIKELLGRLVDGDMDEDEICEFLKETLKVDWETKAQVQYRMQWLLSTGLVRKDGNRYSLAKEEGD